MFQEPAMKWIQEHTVQEEILFLKKVGPGEESVETYIHPTLL